MAADRNDDPATDAEECRRILRAHDHDRYLTALFAGAKFRRRLMALYAFNFEIARIRETVSESLLGEIRLQWWQEAIEGIYGGDVRAHAVARELAHALGEAAVPKALFDKLIEARRADLYDETVKSFEDLEAYCEQTGGALTETAICFAECGDRPKAREAARHVGTAWAITGVVRAIGHHMREGRNVLPDEAYSDAGLARHDLASSEWPDELKAQVAVAADRARARLAAARELRAAVPKTAVPVMLPAVIAEDYLRRLDRAGFDPLRADFAAGAVRRQLRLFRAALTGRY